MSAYDQMKETFFANLEGFGVSETLFLFHGKRKPVKCDNAFCSPPAESSQLDTLGDWDVSRGKIVMEADKGVRLAVGDRVRRDREDDDREFVVSAILTRSPVAVVASIVVKEMDDTYGSGSRAMRGAN